MSAERNNCMYALPHELTGIGTVCGLLQTTCNGLGKMCIAYRKHTAESRAALAKAIEQKNCGEKKVKHEEGDVE